MATDDALTPCVTRSSAAVILTLYERSVLVFFEITIYSVHVYQQATDDALTPCVTRSSAAAILTLYERSVLVFFEITIYSVHVYQYHGY